MKKIQEKQKQMRMCMQVVILFVLLQESWRCIVFFRILSSPFCTVRGFWTFMYWNGIVSLNVYGLILKHIVMNSYQQWSPPLKSSQRGQCNIFHTLLDCRVHLDWNEVWPTKGTWDWFLDVWISEAGSPVTTDRFTGLNTSIAWLNIISTEAKGM